jgi:hypothetical protein
MRTNRRRKYAGVAFFIACLALGSSAHPYSFLLMCFFHSCSSLAFMVSSPSCNNNDRNEEDKTKEGENYMTS